MKKVKYIVLKDKQGNIVKDYKGNDVKCNVVFNKGSNKGEASQMPDGSILFRPDKNGMCRVPANLIKDE